MLHKQCQLALISYNLFIIKQNNKLSKLICSSGDDLVRIFMFINRTPSPWKLSPTPIWSFPVFIFYPLEFSSFSFPSTPLEFHQNCHYPPWNSIKTVTIPHVAYYWPWQRINKEVQNLHWKTILELIYKCNKKIFVEKILVEIRSTSEFQ